MLLLALANLGFWAWSQGWLDAVTGVPAHGTREPERLARQVHPERIVIVPPAGASAPAAAAVDACLEAGPFDDAGFAAAEAALKAVDPALAAVRWADAGSTQPATWMVYMGPFPNREALDAKIVQLKRYRNLEFQEVQHPPELSPGLSLGHFDARDAADKALAQLATRNIRSARVVEAASAATMHRLRVERADAALAAKLTALKADALGAGFAPCVSAETR